MRVGLVCPYDMGAHGGVQDQVTRLARWVREAGHDAAVIAPGESDIDGFVSVGPTTVVPANGAATPLALSPRAIRTVVAALQNVDVAHVHEPLMPQVSLAALRHSPVPLVGTFHADTSVPAGLVYRVGRPLVARWFKKLDVITAVSPIAARVVRFTNRVRIIPNGIDVAAYGASEKRTGSVVFLGRNDPRKGLPILLEAWSQVIANCPEASLTILGSEQTGEPLPGVRFAGRVSEAEKLRHLAEAVIYCAPNLSGESFGIVVAEGMAAGCAVVASGLPAFVRVARDAGRFVAPGDAPGIAAEIERLLGDPEEAAALGSAARRSVQRFDGEVVAAAYIEAYQDAVDHG
jgi:phosphatidylinositol alpha-mannosyltransferase